MIQVYVGNLGAYNRGFLIGKWIELPIDNEELKKAINTILSPIDEEYAIFDSKCDYFEISEYDNIFRINEKAKTLEELNEYELKEFKAISEYIPNFDEAIDVLKSKNYTYLSDVSNEKELGEYVVNNGLFGISIPEPLISYIDYESIGRDWAIDYNFTSDGGAICLY